jgi:hypothetical protein
MANDVAAILAQIASSAQISSRVVVVDVTLRLRADPANSAVVKQLSEQVSGATRKALQDVEETGQKLVAKANGWAKSIRESMSKALEQSASGPAASNGTATTKLEQTAGGKPAAVHPATNGQSQDKPSEGKTTEPPRAKEHIEAAVHFVALMQRVSGLIAGDDETSKQWKEKLEAAKGALEGIGDAVALLTYIKGASASGNPVSGAMGSTGARNLGKSAVGAAGIGAAVGATEAATSATLIVEAGVALHDAVAMNLNWLRVLGGKFDSLTGAVGDWYETTKRNAEISKRIEMAEEAHRSYADQLAQRQAKTNAYYEGRERLYEARKPVHDVTAGADAIGSYKEQFADLKSNGPQTRSDLELEMRRADKERLRHDDQAYVKRFNALYHGEYAPALNRARATEKKNKQLSKEQRPALTFPGQPGVASDRIDAAGQKKIDEQESEAFGEERSEWAKKMAARLIPAYGLYSTLSNPKFKVPDMSLSEMMDPRKWGAALQHKEEEPIQQPERKGVSALAPIAMPEKPDLQDQLKQQEELVKRATELRDLAQQRVSALQSQLANQMQQVQAAKLQVASAREQLQLAQEHVNANRAGLATLSKGEQAGIAKILAKMNQGGELSEQEAKHLKEKGVMQGRIGKTVDARLAASLDPNLVQQLKLAGDEDEVEKAQKNLASATDALKEANDTARAQIARLSIAMDNFADFVQQVIHEEGQVQDTKSKIGNYKNPNEPLDGDRGTQEKRAPASPSKLTADIEAGNNRIVGEFKPLADAILDGQARVRAELRGLAQRIKQANA